MKAESRNPFYSGRFFHSEGGDVFIHVSALCRNPFYSGRFFHSKEMKKEVKGEVSRNPFYSGRFFHSRLLAALVRNAVRSQSLLFRSVFSLGNESEGKGSEDGVQSQSLLFRSVFSLREFFPSASTMTPLSQSLLFRSVFSLRNGASC